MWKRSEQESVGRLERVEKSVICDRRLPGRGKRKVYNTITRLALFYGLETAALTEKRSTAGGGRVEDVKIFFWSD